MLDGLDASYRQALNDWRLEYYVGHHRININARRSNSTVVDTANLRAITTLALSADRGPWHLKGGVLTGKLTYVLDAADVLFDTLRAIDSISPGAATLADQLDARDARYHLYYIGALYDKDNWLVIGEALRRTFDKSFYRDSDGGYMTVGYRFNRWMPYATLARRKSHGPYSDNRGGPLSSYVEELLSGTRYDQSSLALGISREVGPGIALKAQFQWLQPNRNSWGASFFNQSPDGYRLTDPPLFRLISINANMVF